MGLEKAVSAALRKMALVGDAAGRAALLSDAGRHTLASWRRRQLLKVASVGGLTGLVGGPVGVLLEAGDIAYVLSVAGRACLGVGHILGRDVEPALDLPLILALWSDTAFAAATIGPGKVGIKVAGASAAQVALGGARVAGCLVARPATLGRAAAGTIAKRAAAKCMAKAAVKTAMILPFVGAAVSASVNAWVLGGLLGAAERYYTHAYVELGEELAAAMASA